MSLTAPPQSRDAWDVVNYFSMPPADAGFAAPVVDGEAGLPDPFLPAGTEQIFAEGQFNKDVQVIVGKSVFIINIISRRGQPDQTLQFDNGQKTTM